MSRLHVHLSVTDLPAALRFYERLFGAAPTVVKPDYAKWRLEDPRVNFAISTGRDRAGVSHLGLEADSGEELAAISARLAEAGRPLLDEGTTTCCYARSTKQWVSDPDGLAWEAFHTHGESTSYGTSPALASLRAASAPASCDS
ncbi:MAG: ArsI/CadI family heavy metal resistance metalloenzyme [Sphingomonadaceae bacterium]